MWNKAVIKSNRRNFVIGFTRWEKVKNANFNGCFVPNLWRSVEAVMSSFLCFLEAGTIKIRSYRPIFEYFRYCWVVTVFVTWIRKGHESRIKVRWVQSFFSFIENTSDGEIMNIRIHLNEFKSYFAIPSHQFWTICLWFFPFSLIWHFCCMPPIYDTQ